MKGEPLNSELLERCMAKVLGSKAALGRLVAAAEHACRELSSANAHLNGTLLEDAESLCTQIDLTLAELRTALHDCRA